MKGSISAISATSITIVQANGTQVTLGSNASARVSVKGSIEGQPGQTTASTKGGYWLVNVLEKADSRKIDDTDRDLLKSQALNQWAGSLWVDPSYKIEDFMDQAKLDYAVAHI